MTSITGITKLFGVVALTLTCGARAQSIEVKDAWIRGTVPAQRGTGAFMEITGKSAVRLIGAASPVAGTVEIHNRTMTNGVMKMFAVDGIDVAAGKTIKLAPGGYHVMMMDLKAALPKGSTVPLTLVFKDAKGVESKMELKLPVSAVAPTAP